MTQSDKSSDMVENSVHVRGGHRVVEIETAVLGYEAFDGHGLTYLGACHQGQFKKYYTTVSEYIFNQILWSNMKAFKKVHLNLPSARVRSTCPKGKPLAAFSLLNAGKSRFC